MDPASYSMSHRHRGKFIIFSNKNFARTSQLAVRRSADHDVLMLQDSFSRIGFDVVVHCDTTALQMLAIIADGIYVFLFSS